MAFTAQYPGTCKVCNGPIEVGQAIKWARRGEKGISHSECSLIPVQQQAPLLSSAAGSKFERPEPYPASSAPHPPANSASDPGNVFAGLAAAIQPYIVATVSDIDERVNAAIQSALDSLPKVTIQVHNNRTGETKEIAGQHALFTRLVRLAELRKNVYAWGEAGSGKSTAARTLAKLLGLSFGYLACNNQTPEYRLTGFVDAHGVYSETDFYRCYKNGGLFLLDEADAANGNLMCSLNGALANHSASFPCGTVDRHPDFICIATGNTPGFGPTPAFPDRRPLDGAFRDRFAFLEWNTDVELELNASIAQNQENGKEWSIWVRKVRSYAKTAVPKLIVTQRASIEGSSLLTIFPAADVAEMVVFKGIDRDSVSKILASYPVPQIGRGL